MEQKKEPHPLYSTFPTLHSLFHIPTAHPFLHIPTAHPLLHIPTPHPLPHNPYSTSPTPLSPLHILYSPLLYHVLLLCITFASKPQAAEGASVCPIVLILSQFYETPLLAEVKEEQ